MKTQIYCKHVTKLGFQYLRYQFVDGLLDKVFDCTPEEYEKNGLVV